MVSRDRLIFDQTFEALQIHDLDLETLLTTRPMIAQKTEILGEVGTQSLAEADRNAHSSCLPPTNVFFCGKRLDQIARRLPYKIEAQTVHAECLYAVAFEDWD
jgi:hypothetical protein